MYNKMLIIIVVLGTIILIVIRATLHQPYFPIVKTDKDHGLSEFQDKWFSKILIRMEEPRLLDAKKDSGQCIYRLLIIPSWDNPISIRVQKKGPVYLIFTRRLNGDGGCDPGGIAEQINQELSETNSRMFESFLKAVNFFEMPVNDEVIGCDGEEWIMEGVSDGKYHVITRWCASIVDSKKRGLEPFLDLCKYLIDYSGLTNRPRHGSYELLPIRRIKK